MKKENKQAILDLIDELKDLNYLIFAGFATHLYSKGKRDFQDIDILFRYEDLNKFAKRVGESPEKRTIEEGGFIAEDYYFEMNYKGQELEAIGILPDRQKDIDFFEKTIHAQRKKKLFWQRSFPVTKRGCNCSQSNFRKRKRY